MSYGITESTSPWKSIMEIGEPSGGTSPNPGKGVPELGAMLAMMSLLGVNSIQSQQTFNWTFQQISYESNT